MTGTSFYVSAISDETRREFNEICKGAYQDAECDYNEAKRIAVARMNSNDNRESFLQHALDLGLSTAMRAVRSEVMTSVKKAPASVPSPAIALSVNPNRPGRLAYTPPRHVPLPRRRSVETAMEVAQNALMDFTMPDGRPIGKSTFKYVREQGENARKAAFGDMQRARFLLRIYALRGSAPENAAVETVVSVDQANSLRVSCFLLSV